ncbi:MAG: oligogalacturonate lyase family protein [Candidatus Omnitrophica bacterium]|nr:oligogalacturonate lyase family protein [Candidatus Omnitrophota bacterium]
MIRKWQAEACDLLHDPVSGALITRLTCSVMHNINIYCEQPYTSPDGKRIAYTRSFGPDPRVPPYQLCVADIEKLRVMLVEPEVKSVLVGTSAWSGKIYYLTSEKELAMFDISSLEKEIILTSWELGEDVCFDTVSPDHRYLVCTRRTENGSEIIRIDTKERTWKVIFRHQEILSHVQFNPVHGKDILVQHNRHQKIKSDGTRVGSKETEEFTTHFIIDIEGKNFRQLKVGPPYTAGSTGHSGWIADTGKIGLTVRWPAMSEDEPSARFKLIHDSRHSQGNFVVVGPDDEKPFVFSAPEHLFNHVNISKCGTYFVCDSYKNGIPGPIEIVVGNIKTGKYRTLVSNCGAQGGGAACSHPHPYITADNKNVIFNADPFGISHVHAARIPDDFLKSLE